MSSAEDPAGDVTTYVYTAAEQRIEKETDADTVKFLWDGQNILQEYDELDVTQVDYTNDPRPAPQPFGNLISQHRDAASSFYHYDALGSTRALTDSSEVETDDYAYEAFGKVASSTGSTTNPFRWVGAKGIYTQEDDRRWMRARELDAASGRFLSEDPARDDSNLYRYVGNNPTNAIDPSGLEQTDGNTPLRPTLATVAFELGLVSQEDIDSGQFQTLTITVPESDLQLQALNGPGTPSLAAQPPATKPVVVQIPTWFLELPDRQKVRVIRAYEQKLIDRQSELRRFRPQAEEETRARPGFTKILQPRHGHIDAKYVWATDSEISAQREGLRTIDPQTGEPFGLKWPVEIFPVPERGLPRMYSNPSAESDWYVMVDGLPWRLYPGDKERLLKSVDGSAFGRPVALLFGFAETFDEVRIDIESRARVYRADYQYDRGDITPFEYWERRNVARHRQLEANAARFQRAADSYGMVLSGVGTARSLTSRVAQRGLRRSAASVVDNIPPQTQPLGLGRFSQELNADPSTRILLNRTRGSVFDDVAAQAIEGQFINLESEVTILPFVNTEGTLATKAFRADRLGIDTSTFTARPIEFKSSYRAPLRTNQRRGFPQFGQFGGQVRGQGGGLAFPEGTVLDATDPIVIRPQDLPREARIQFGRDYRDALLRLQSSSDF